MQKGYGEYDEFEDDDELEDGQLGEEDEVSEPQRLRAVLQITLFIFISILILKSFALDFVHISSNSMGQTLKAGDYILVSRLSYFFGLPDRVPFLNFRLPDNLKLFYKSPSVNDIAILHMPLIDEYKRYAKRIIAGPGDVVEIVGKNVFVNRISEEDINSADQNTLGNTCIRIPAKGDTVYISPSNSHMYINADFYINPSLKIAIADQDYYFVAGDNRNISLDSRLWGIVPENNFIGRPILIYWSTYSSINGREIDYSRIGTWIE